MDFHTFEKVTITYNQIFPELIEETRRPPGLIVWHTGLSLGWLGQVRVLDENSQPITEL